MDAPGEEVTSPDAQGHRLVDEQLTDHISAAMVGLGMGRVAALPCPGVLDQEDVKRINCPTVFCFNTAVSMGEVPVETHALETLTAIMFAWMQPLITNIYRLAVVPYWMAFVYPISLGNKISMLGTSVPALMNFAAAKGLHPLALGMIWTFAAGDKIFVYRSGVVIACYSYADFDAQDTFRVGLGLTIVESLALLLLVPFYWPLIRIRMGFVAYGGPQGWAGGQV